ncbi:MAG TPA: thioesterase family protein, partial [Solirubrobacteraceae bacterium]|nr:thioesterase family protein [Solirubrobacteraceae bacterium]
EADALHGGAPAALLAEAAAAAGPGGDATVVVRLTYEFLGPVPFAPLAVSAEVVRPGRRFQLVEGTLSAAGRDVVRVRAVRLRRGAVELPPETGPHEARPPGPETAREDPFPPVPGMPSEGFHRTGMEIRFAGGTDFGEGPALAWFRLGRPLVDERPPSPLARAAAAADFGNGVAHALPFGEWLFVNTDLTVHLHREPAGEWVLLDARTRLDERGVGVAMSTLHDERGPIGLAAQSLFVDRR